MGSFVGLLGPYFLMILFSIICYHSEMSDNIPWFDRVAWPVIQCPICLPGEPLLKADA